MNSQLLHLFEQLSNDLSTAKTIILIADCEIEYWGRGRSIVGCGDRIILMKPDSTLIIHSPAGFKPLNWMSGPTDTSVYEEGKHLIIHSQRTLKPFEEIKIKVLKIIDYQSYEGLKDCGKQELIHNEKDMQDYLASHTHMIHPDFRLKSKEYRSPLGFFDLYGKIGETYAVIELKAERAGLPASLQIKRYKDWLTKHLKQDVIAILIAPGITDNARNLLKKEGIEYKKFNIKKIKRTPKPKHTLDKWMNA